MKIRLTIPMIAFALALAGMSVRAHTSCFMAVDSAPAATNVIDQKAVPAIRALPPTPRRSMPPDSAGALNLEQGATARRARCPNPQS